MRKHNRGLAILFSTIPGAGHMYVGLQKQGLQLMSSFFFMIFFADWTDLGIFMCIVPIIWFYSFFDVLNKTSREGPIDDDDIIFVSWINNRNSLFNEKNKFVAYALIIIGIVLIIEKIIFPWISWELKNYIETGILSLVFILGGVRLLLGNKIEDKSKLGENIR